MLSELKIVPGVPYLTLGTVEQIEWVMSELDYDLHYLFEPSCYDIHTAFSFSDPFEEKPRVYIVHLKDYKVNTEFGIPRDKKLDICPDHYYFFVMALTSGDITLQLEDGKEYDQKKVAKELSGKPYVILDLTKVDYGFPEAKNEEERLINEFYLPFPKTYHYKLRTGLPLTTFKEWGFTTAQKRLVESLNQQDGYLLWGNLTDSDLHAYFGRIYWGDYAIFKAGNASGLSTYLQPFLERVFNSGSNLAFKAPLAEFAMWCYFSHKYWGEVGQTGLIPYVPKRGRKKEKGVEKAYIFKPSNRAQEEWLRLLQRGKIE